LIRADIATPAHPALGSRGWLALIPVLLIALLLRGMSIYQFDYPTGPDYGLHLLYGELFLQAGKAPVYAPNYQLSATSWPLMPGGPLVYALMAGISGTDVFDLIHVTSFFGVIEVAGVYLLAWRIFKRLEPALIAALVIAVLPVYVDMMSWAGYPNFIALSLMPLAFLAWLDYWERPDWRRLILAVIAVCGAAYIHHVSTLWLGQTLVLFAALQVITQPVRSLRKLIPIGIAGVLLGLPIALSAVRLALDQGAVSVLTSADRFDASRLTWETWARVVTPMAVVLGIGGMIAFLRSRVPDRAAKFLIAAYAVVTLVYLFGWVIGLRFYYIRALFFVTLPVALGAAALIDAWRSPLIRIGVTAVLIVSIGTSAIIRAASGSAYFEIVTPDLIEAVDWLKDYSQPDDVIVMGTLLGFQLPHLLDRPMMAALSPDLISNADALATSSDATAVMMGLSNMDAVIAAREVRYVIVRTHTPDVPDPIRSRAVMNAHPRLELVFRNDDVLIYEVGS
jgi:hypothetical protein